MFVTDLHAGSSAPIESLPVSFLYQSRMRPTKWRNQRHARIRGKAIASVNAQKSSVRLHSGCFLLQLLRGANSSRSTQS